MRRLNNQVLQLLRSGGPFVGQWKAQSRVTVQPDFWLNQSSGPVGNRPAAKLPIRWWQRQDNSQIEVEIPNVKQVQIVRDLTQQAATVEVDIYNTTIPVNGTAQPLPGGLGEPGFFSWSYGSTAEAQSRWNQTPNVWSNVLRENALIRVYQGYGGYHLDGTRMTIPEAVSQGYLILKGVFLLDSPAIESNGITKLQGRDMAKLLIDQMTVPPLIPAAKYPINYWGPGQATATTPAATNRYGLNSWGQQRAVYHNSSQAAVHGATEAAAAAANAFDSNHATCWVSEVVGAADDIVWIELDSQEEITGVYIDPVWGNYRCYVSVLSNGTWLGSGTIGGVPYVTEFGVPLERSGWYLLPRRYMAQRVRLTFSNLWPSFGGYAASIRELQLGIIEKITTTDRVVLDMSVTPSGHGYRIFGSDGAVYDYGDAAYFGSKAGQALNAGIVGGAGTRTNKGYYLAGADGGVFTFGDAVYRGSTGSIHLNAPMVAFRLTPDGGGYYMCAADGGVFTFGDAPYYGSLGASYQINIVDMAVKPQNSGYWLLGEDGSIYTFGTAFYYGASNNPAHADDFFVGVESTATGNGYWMATDKGLVVTFGDAINYGGTSTVTLNAPISGIKRTPSGHGYRLIAQDGGVFDFGDAVFYGSLPGDFTYALPADYTDYAGIIEDFALWAGFWLAPTGPLPANQPPAVFGNIETTGAWDTIGPLGIQFFDKRPVVDVMTDIAGFVGYLIRVDDSGGLRFEAPNVWAVGNFYDDQTPTSYLPVIDERINLSDYLMTQSDQDLRSPIIVAVADPYEYGGPVPGTNVTTFIPPYANLLRGLTKSAMYAIPLQVAAKDQQFFAELIALRIWFQTRTGSVTAWCDPSIEVDDQIRIYERNSGETNVQYVQAITTTHDLDTGKFEMQITTYWLGGHDTGWAVTSDLSSFFGSTNTYPVTTLTPGAAPTLTLVEPPSVGLSLPQTVIHVVATTGMTTSGNAYVETDAGTQVVTYTGLTATSMTGCRGGTGKMFIGTTVQTLNTSTTSGTGTFPAVGQTFPISNQLALFLGASGAKTTRVFAVGAVNT